MDGIIHFLRVLAELLLGIHIIEAEKIDIQQTQK
jgi:hypothetical protein